MGLPRCTVHLRREFSGEAGGKGGAEDDAEVHHRGNVGQHAGAERLGRSRPVPERPGLDRNSDGLRDLRTPQAKAEGNRP
jgi:hypothetical protein